MNGLITLIKIFAAILVIAILVIGFVVVKTFLEERELLNLVAADAKPLEKIIEENDAIDFEPGQYEFNRALQLIALQKLDEAREKLLFIQNLYPNSSVAPESRRILGEINLDRILSVENMTNKKIHKVAPGEGYLLIANRNDTTLDCIMFLNGLTEQGRLHAGDEFVVMPLDFKLLVDLKNRRVELFHRDAEKKEHVFAKDYPIDRVDIGSLRSGSHQSKIERKLGELSGHSYPPTHEKFRHATTVLGFKVRGRYLQFRPIPAADTEDPGQGIFLKPSDMEELSMLIRVGNEVEVKNP